MIARLVRIAALVICLLAAVGTHAAESNAASLIGRLLDIDGRTPIAGAVIRSDEITATSDADGQFTLEGLAPGHHQILISARGFRPVSRSIEISPGANNLGSVVLESDAVQLSDLQVTSPTSDAESRFQDRTSSEALTDSASETTLNNANLQNGSDIAKDVAGVAVSKGANGTSTVSVRGIDQRMLRFTVDGQRQGSGGNPLDSIPAEIVQSLEVTKTFTPDMDADAVGGVININTGGVVIKDAYEQGRHQVSYDPLSPHPSIRNSITLARPYALFSDDSSNASSLLTLSFDDLYSRRERLSSLREWTPQVSPGPAPYTGLAIPVLTLPLVESTGEHRQRSGAVFNSDARLDAFSLFLRSNFNRDWTRRNRYFDDTNPASGEVLTLGPDAAVFSGVALSRRNQDQTTIRDATNLSLGVKPNPGTAREWTAVASYGLTHEDEPHTLETGFLSEDLYRVGYDLRSNAYAPSFTFANELNPADLTSISDPTRYHMDYFSTTRTELREEDGSVKLDLQLNRDGGSYIKVGAKAEHRRRRVGIDRDFFDAGPAPLDASSVPGPSLVSLRTAPYEIGSLPSARSVASARAGRADSFALNAAHSAINSATGAYAVNEDFWALYAMGKHRFRKAWSLIGGLRLEGTRVDSSANQMSLDANTGQLQGFVPARARNEYVELLPGLHFRYEPAATLLYRGSVTRSISRPGNADIAPYRTLSFVDKRSRIGAPDLKPYLSTNLDLSVDKYTDAFGLLSVALFYKKIDHFITDAQYPVTIGNLGEFIEFKRINGEAARSVGGEINWQSPTWVWPFDIGRVSIEANYSHNHGTAHYPTRPGETFPLPRQVEHQGGLKVHDVRGPLTLDASISYRTGWWEDQIAPGFDNYISSAWDAELSGTYKFGKSTRITAGINNLLDEPTKHYAGSPSRMNDWQRSGREFNVGLQWKL